MKTFELKEWHIELLKNMYVDWCDDEYGAPAIDPKRPYGNSDVDDDIGEILNDAGLEETNMPEYYQLHEETQTALQILLLNAGKELKPGTYVLEIEYDERSWVLQKTKKGK